MAGSTLSTSMKAWPVRITIVGAAALRSIPWNGSIPGGDSGATASACPSAAGAGDIPICDSTRPRTPRPGAAVLVVTSFPARCSVPPESAALACPPGDPHPAMAAITITAKIVVAFIGYSAEVSEETLAEHFVAHGMRVGDGRAGCVICEAQRQPASHTRHLQP